MFVRRFGVRSLAWESRPKFQVKERDRAELVWYFAVLSRLVLAGTGEHEPPQEHPLSHWASNLINSAAVVDFKSPANFSRHRLLDCVYGSNTLREALDVTAEIAGGDRRRKRSPSTRCM